MKPVTKIGLMVNCGFPDYRRSLQVPAKAEPVMLLPGIITALLLNFIVIGLAGLIKANDNRKK